MNDRLFGRVDRRRLIGCLVALGGMGALRTVQAHEAMHVHDQGDHSVIAPGSDFKRREAQYQVPAVTMVDQRGRRVVLSKALDDGRPVILNFIFTSCTAICPVMTQIFTEVQARLVGELDKIHMVSVSIDPEYDTPARLAAYTREHSVGPQWDFYTGSGEASVAVQKAFDMYRGDKMNHEAVTLLRGPRGRTWVRLEGFASPAAIVGAYRALAA